MFQHVLLDASKRAASHDVWLSLSVERVRPRKTQDLVLHFILKDLFQQMLLCGSARPTMSWDFPLELNRFSSLHLHSLIFPTWNWPMSSRWSGPTPPWPGRSSNGPGRPWAPFLSDAFARRRASNFTNELSELLIIFPSRPFCVKSSRNNDDLEWQFWKRNEIHFLHM